MKYITLLGIILLSFVYSGCTSHTTIVSDTNPTTGISNHSIDPHDIYTGGVINIIHKAQTGIYGGIYFNVGYQDEESINQSIIYNKRKSQGFDCKKGDFAIGGNAKCFNSLGYVHTYEIPQLNISIGQTTNGIYDKSRQPLTKDPKEIFLISGTTLYTTFDIEKPLNNRIAISYNIFGVNDNSQSIITKQYNTIYPNKYMAGTGDFFSSGDNEEYHFSYLYSGDYQDNDDLSEFVISYYFNRKKGYYYTAYNTPISEGEDGDRGEGHENILHYVIHFFQ